MGAPPRASEPKIRPLDGPHPGRVQAGSDASDSQVALFVKTLLQGVELGIEAALGLEGGELLLQRLAGFAHVEDLGAAFQLVDLAVQRLEARDAIVHAAVGI